MRLHRPDRHLAPLQLGDGDSAHDALDLVEDWLMPDSSAPFRLDGYPSDAVELIKAQARLSSLLARLYVDTQAQLLGGEPLPVSFVLERLRVEQIPRGEIVPRSQKSSEGFHG